MSESGPPVTSSPVLFHLMVRLKIVGHRDIFIIRWRAGILQICFTITLATHTFHLLYNCTVYRCVGVEGWMKWTHVPVWSSYPTPLPPPMTAQGLPCFPCTSVKSFSLNLVDILCWSFRSEDSTASKHSDPLPPQASLRWLKGKNNKFCLKHQIVVQVLWGHAGNATPAFLRKLLCLTPGTEQPGLWPSPAPKLSQISLLGQSAGSLTNPWKYPSSTKIRDVHLSSNVKD